MAKISLLPELLGPTGTETVVILHDNETKRARMSSLVRGVTGPVLQGRPTLGDMMDRATVTMSPQNGATAQGRVLSLPAGSGDGSYFVYEAEVLEVDRRVLPVGTPCRVRAVSRVSAGFAAAAGMPTEIWKTRIIRRSTPLGGSENLGEVDLAASGYVGDFLIWETCFNWEADITHVGGLVQFPSVDAVPQGVVTIEPVGLALLIDSVEERASSAADLVRTIEEQRVVTGYATRYSVGPKASDGPVSGFANVELAGEALKPATLQTRQRLELGATIDPTKIKLTDFVDLVGRKRRFARMVYNGPNTLTDATRTDHETIRTLGNAEIASIWSTIRNGNYPDHSESANSVRNWTQRVTSCEFRHDGSEEAFVAGNLSEGGRYTPAGGWGLSSGSRRIVNFSKYTSAKGGGVYFHNAQGQERPAYVYLGPGRYGGDDPYSADITVTTLASGTDDIAEIVGATFTTGYISYGTSQSHADPMLDFADQADFEIYARACRPFILGSRTLTGRALRIRAKTPGDGLVTTSGSAHEVVLQLGYRVHEVVIGEPGRKPASVGVANVAGTHSIGWRLGDCRGTPKQLIVNVRGSIVTVTFDADMRGQSNETILAQINAVLGDLATADLFAAGQRVRAFQPEREAMPINTGPVGIHQGTMVVLTMGDLVCRNAEPSDFSQAGALLDPDLRIGVALEDIPIDRSGRVQVSGWVNWEDMVCDAEVKPNLGDGFAPVVNADGVHGAISYRGSGGEVLRCIRPEMNNGRGRYTPPILLLR